MNRARRWRLPLIVLAALGAAAALFLTWGVDYFFSPRPPALPGAEPVLTEPLRAEADGTTRLGEAYRFNRSGVDACSLSGTAWARGVALGRLYSQEIQWVEISLMQTVRRFLPWGWVRWAASKFVMVRNRNLDRYIPEAVLREMHGLAQGSPDVFPEYGEHYARLLNYLAAHDLSHALMDDAALAGCTAFGATARAASGGQVLLARNFDFEAGPAFDRYKVVLRVQPDAGHAFLSVAWPGMFGVVTGCNDAGIGVVLLAGHSQDPPGVGTPISVVARQVLEQAQTLDQAIAVIRAARVFVSESFLIGSGSENAFVVVEKTPKRCGVRGRGESVVLAANHFLSPELARDPKNTAYLASGTSRTRWLRLQELVQGAGPLDPARCAGILRDRRAPGGGAEGLGNRGAINALIASHSVVMDLRRKIIWVSAGPNTLGEYVPFALEGFDRAPDAPAIPADPLLNSAAYRQYPQYLAQLEQGEEKLKGGHYREALAFFLEARPLNPEHYRSYQLAGEALLAIHHEDEARDNFERALQLQPAFPQERRSLETSLRKLKARETP